MTSADGAYFGLTAGHVMPDGDSALAVKTNDGDLVAGLELVERLLRAQGRPQGKSGEGVKSWLPR